MCWLRKKWAASGRDGCKSPVTPSAGSSSMPGFSNGQVTGEHWAEKVAAEVAGLLHIPHARVELATLDGSPGCISRRFPELARPGAELIHGNDLLAGAVFGYDRTKQFRQSNHTVENILAAISHVLPDPEEQKAAFQQMAGYLVLDAIILNTDRHHENWAIVRVMHQDGRVSHEMAPTFDHASSLGRNEPPDKLVAWLSEPGRPEWYATRSHGEGEFIFDPTTPTGPILSGFWNWLRANGLTILRPGGRRWKMLRKRPFVLQLAGCRLGPWFRPSVSLRRRCFE